jgi:uncharacterized protein YeaO (DUF488 family)
MIAVKRAYNPVSRADGTRFLVERLWPRGISKAKLGGAVWLKEVGPSAELRQWFSHAREVGRVPQTARRELDSRAEAWQPILSAVRRGLVTLVYSSHYAELNNAIALQEYLEAKMRQTPRPVVAVRAARRPAR